MKTFAFVYLVSIQAFLVALFVFVQKFCLYVFQLKVTTHYFFNNS